MGMHDDMYEYPTPKNARELIKELKSKREYSFYSDEHKLIEAFRENGLDYIHTFVFDEDKVGYALGLQTYLQKKDYVIADSEPNKDYRGETYGWTFKVALPLTGIKND